MSKLSFELTRIDVPEKGNYFLLVQLDETEYPSKLTRTQKYRTEIDYSTEFPSFQKNYFVFNNVQLGNKLTFRIGLFTLTNVNGISQKYKNNNNIPSKILFSNATLLGSKDIKMTTTWIERLRRHKYVESDTNVIHPEIRDKETGNVFYKIYYKTETLDTLIYDDVQEIESVFYDPFEKDKDVIKEKLKMVVVLNEERQMNLKKIQNKLDKIINEAKYASREKEKILIHLKECENENTQLTKSILKLQNYDEIHIEIDLLSQSPQGIDILEKKYAVLQGQLAIQKQIRSEYEEQYKTMEPIMSKLNIYKNRLSVMKAANTELLFNHKRHKDMLPLITTYQEKIKNNDNLIQNYKNNITDIIAIRNQNSELSIEEIAKRIEIFDKERKKLEEKKMQLNLYIDVYFKQGNETKRDKTYAELTEPFYRIVGNDPTMNKIINDSEEKLMEMNKQRIDELEKEAKMLSKQITDFDENEKNQKEQGIVINPLMIKTRNDLKDKIEMEENKVKYLLEEIEKNQNAFLDAKEVLKDKIAYFDDMIERELKYARIRKYEEESKLHGMDYY